MSYQTFACFYLWMTIVHEQDYYCSTPNFIPTFYSLLTLKDNLAHYMCIECLMITKNMLVSQILPCVERSLDQDTCHIFLQIPLSFLSIWPGTEQKRMYRVIPFCLNKFIINRRSPYNNLLYIIPIKETVLPHMWSWFLHLETALFWIHLSRSHPQSDHHCNQCQVSCESKYSIRRYFHQFPQQFLEEIAKQQHQKEFNLLTLY